MVEKGKSQQTASLGIAICGLGTVGGGVLDLLHRHAGLIDSRAQRPLRVVRIATRSGPGGRDLAGVACGNDVFDAVADPAVQVIVETIGGTDVARQLVEAALHAGKHVVTANKALIAEHGNELLALARAQGVSLRFEAAVAGAIPVLKALREGLAANRIAWLAGIINGTGNFILSEMTDKGRDFAEVLAEAQALGYAEADPTFDVEGIDAAHKLVILASIAFGMPLRFDAVFTEGISAITPADLRFAAELGYAIKHLGVARQGADGVELRVHPALVPRTSLLASVNGVMNAVMVDADAAGPSLYYGAGAGALATASAVLADVIDLARSWSGDQALQAPALGVPQEALEDFSVLPIDRVSTPWYLHMQVEDKPGVMSQVSSIFGAQGISIEALIQKPPARGTTRVSVVVITNCASQASLKRAVASIEALDAIHGRVARIRVENLETEAAA